MVHWWVTYQFSYAIRHNDVFMVAISNDVLKLEKLSNFKVHELSWTVNEFCSCLFIDEKYNLIFARFANVLRN